jgi:hypothetical protein
MVGSCSMDVLDDFDGGGGSERDDAGPEIDW